MPTITRLFEEGFGPSSRKRLRTCRSSPRRRTVWRFSTSPGRNGARAFVLKDSSPIEVVNAIEAVYSGNYYFSPEISGQIVQSLIEGGRHKRDDEPEERLTERQQEILRLICDGRTEREIGDALNISHHTVHVHKNNIMNLLNLHSKVDLVKYAVKNRIIQL